MPSRDPQPKEAAPSAKPDSRHCTFGPSSGPLSSAGPRASIVLCVHNREKSVIATLESLVASAFGDFEIVAVDDASTDGSLEVLRDFKRTHSSTSMTIVRNSRNLGVSGARNSGIDAAKGGIVLFTDSDCVVGRNWLELHTGAFDQPAVVAACGPVEDAPPSNYVEKAHFGSARVGVGRLQGRSLIGGNMSFRRDVLLDFRFDPALQYGCDEDDIAWRLRSEEHRIAFVPEALVRHRHPLDLSHYLWMAYRQGQGSARFWYKKDTFLGRDIAALAAAVLTLPLGLLDSSLLLIPASLVTLQCLAYLFNETAFKRRRFGLAVWVLPGLMTYGIVKLWGIAVTYLRLLLGLEDAIRKSKREWKKRCAARA